MSTFNAGSPPDGDSVVGDHEPWRRACLVLAMASQPSEPTRRVKPASLSALASTRCPRSINSNHRTEKCQWQSGGWPERPGREQRWPRAPELRVSGERRTTLPVARSHAFTWLEHDRGEIGHVGGGEYPCRDVVE